MQIDVERLPKSLVKISVSIEVAEMRPYLEAAARALAQVSKLEGFRPGKAPYELLVARFGESKIWEAAAEPAVRAAYVRAVRERELPVIGEPSIELLKLAPGNPFVFAATAPVLPAVTRLADYRTFALEKKPLTVADTAVDRALQDLQKMQTREAQVDRATTVADKAVVNVTISRDRVPIEGGVARSHQVYLSEPYYVPGFTAELVGLKKGDKKSFSLSFPADHYQKSLAEKPVDFDIEVLSVVALTPPALDDAFAATLGQKSLAELRALLRRNLESEAAEKEAQRQEIAALELLVSGSEFEDVPELMINEESERMVGELETEIGRRELSFDDYLASVKKSRADLKLGFAPAAVKRIKTALAVREVGRREHLEPSDQEVADEVARQAAAYADNAAAQAEVRKPEYEAVVRTQLRNRKIVEFLRTLAVKS